MSSPAAKSPYVGYRFPAEVISHAVWLYSRFPLSLRMVEEMLAARGIVVSQSFVGLNPYGSHSPPLAAGILCCAYGSAGLVVLAGACLALLMRSARSTPDVAQPRLGRQLFDEVPYGRRGSASTGLALSRNAGG